MSEIKKTFAYHKPSEDGLRRIKDLRESFSELYDEVESLAPASRERSLAITALEEAAMWAIKAVVVHDPESVVDDR